MGNSNSSLKISEETKAETESTIKAELNKLTVTNGLNGDDSEDSSSGTSKDSSKDDTMTSSSTSSSSKSSREIRCVSIRRTPSLKAKEYLNVIKQASDKTGIKDNTEK